MDNRAYNQMSEFEFIERIDRPEREERGARSRSITKRFRNLMKSNNNN